MVALEDCKPFRHLNPSELSALRSIARERSFRSGQEIFREGDAGDGVYVMRSGQVELSALLSSNIRKTVAQVAPGEMFGEMSVLEELPRSATATATRDSAAFFIAHFELLSMIHHSPRLALGMLGEMSRCLRSANQRYAQETSEAERLALVGRFVRSILHDIKNPLNLISLASTASTRKHASIQAREQAADTIQKQIEKINELITDIGDFTQCSAARVEPLPLDYPAFVAQIIEELRPDVELHGVALKVKSAPPVKVAVHPKRLKRVFANLIRNSIEAMAGGGTITIQFAVVDDEVLTEVEDTGPGIPPDLMDTLFNPFVSHGKSHGSGLGLSICKGILEDHRGRIWTRKEPRRGSIFSFALPIKSAPAQSSAAQSQSRISILRTRS